MIPALKSEFRKLLSVRSTYFIVGTSLLIVAFFAGFIGGFRADPADLLHNPGILADNAATSMVFMGLILAFAGLLLAGHEYRYNTIMYTLTVTNRRSKVLFAKIGVITVFAIITSLIVTFLGPFCAILGAHLAGKELGPQVFDVWPIVWRCVFCGWGYAMYAFILMMVLRNQIGAIVTFLLVPLIGENILGLLLKSNVKYLPFNALQSVPAQVSLGNHHSTGSHGVLTVFVYVGVGLAVSLFLFLKRDAN